MTEHERYEGADGILTAGLFSYMSNKPRTTKTDAA